ncbi:hypothetical protein [Aquitalea sp. LB_tupeE]|uniref:hypothetical protein n=1 Tax=Aquitalea sp. LB_tupeE TaxID=2748078 RepID=UPI0015BE60FD|nr:hypothetical protein [Aquitalea sp. LB_tupeE]NWK79707.1 hypothetical protein [Aquitalea sp. LB_tupeE]
MTRYQLHITAHHTSLTQAAQSAHSMPTGWQSALPVDSHTLLPTTAGLEMAIMQVEDAISASWPQHLALDTVYSSDAELQQLATLCGLPDTAGNRLERQQVESLFARLANAVEGGLTSGLPATQAGMGQLLIVRELMHHLDIASITLLEPAA